MDRVQKQISEKLEFSASWFAPEEIESVTSEGGAYILLLRLEKPVNIVLPGQVQGQLLPGWFAYAGSARNKGGIRARLRHHFRANKKQHWHIDRLTMKATWMAALPVPAGDECNLLSQLLQSPGFYVAINGFGSSDCGICESHLLAASR